MKYTLRWVAKKDSETTEDLFIKYTSQPKAKPVVRLVRDRTELGWHWVVKFYGRDLILMARSKTLLKRTCKLLVEAFIKARG